MVKHGDYNSPEYKKWRGMLTRCRNPKHESYRFYGGRGITVCERWLDYANFLADMGRLPSPKHSLDRIDNDRGYEPDNCRWIPVNRQQANRRTNQMVTFNGKTQTVNEWARELGLTQSMLCKRLAAGEPAETAFTRPSARTPRIKNDIQDMDGRLSG